MSTAEQQNALKKPQWMEAGMINAYEASYKSKPPKSKPTTKQPGCVKKSPPRTKRPAAQEGPALCFVPGPNGDWVSCGPIGPGGIADDASILAMLEAQDAEEEEERASK